VARPRRGSPRSWCWGKGWLEGYSSARGRFWTGWTARPRGSRSGRPRRGHCLTGARPSSWHCHPGGSGDLGGSIRHVGGGDDRAVRCRGRSFDPLDGVEGPDQGSRHGPCSGRSYRLALRRPRRASSPGDGRGAGRPPDRCPRRRRGNLWPHTGRPIGAGPARPGPSRVWDIEPRRIRSHLHTATSTRGTSSHRCPGSSSKALLPLPDPSDRGHPDGTIVTRAAELLTSNDIARARCWRGPGRQPSLVTASPRRDGISSLRL